MSDIKKIAILTGGGDCSGLNAVIRGVTKTAINKYGYEVIGFIGGYHGLYMKEYVELTLDTVDGILSQGGTILKNSNKDNLFNFRQKDENGKYYYSDQSDVAVKHLKELNVDALVIVGGDGTLTSARDFARKGVKVVGVPKTIDNDVPATDITFGYSTALDTIAHALDCLHTTAYSHDRVLLLEVMGRGAGWLALEGGIAGAADAILLPEIPYDVNKIVKHIEDRFNKGLKNSIVVVSEGAKPLGGEVAIKKIVADSPDSVRLGGAAEILAQQLEALLTTGQEVRSTNLGYVQRGGNTNCYDRVLGTRYGSFAADMVARGEFGRMAALQNTVMTTVSIEEVVGSGETGETSHGGGKMVNPDSEVVKAAKAIGICFGD